MSKVVLDAMVLLNLAKLDALETVLEALQGTIVVGALLDQKEIIRWPEGSKRAGEPFSLDPFVNAGRLERAEMTDTELGQFESVKQQLRLGDGETEAFILCASRGWNLATDDKSARNRMSLHNPKVPLVRSVELVARAHSLGRLQDDVAARLKKDLERLSGRCAASRSSADTEGG